MGTSQIVALVGAVLVAFVVRVSNMVVKWLARVLRVDPPEEIESPIDHGGQTS